jgi:hypothetical protein
MTLEKVTGAAFIASIGSMVNAWASTPIKPEYPDFFTI